MAGHVIPAMINFEDAQIVKLSCVEGWNISSGVTSRSRQIFRVVVPQEGLQHLAVVRQAVGPEIVPHEFARGAKLLVEERQRALAGRGILQLLQAFGL